MSFLFEEDARGERHPKHDPYHPDAGAVEALPLSYHLAHVDADEEDWHAAPENLQMAYGMVDGSDILHKDAPHDHDHRQPAIDGVALDKLHVAWCKEIEHHGGGNVPEVQLVVKPEIPVDADVAHEVDPCPEVSSLKTRNVEQAGYDEPGGIDAQITAHEEVAHVRILGPREPQTYTAEEEKQIKLLRANPYTEMSKIPIFGNWYVSVTSRNFTKLVS